MHTWSFETNDKQRTFGTSLDLHEPLQAPDPDTSSVANWIRMSKHGGPWDETTAKQSIRKGKVIESHTDRVVQEGTAYGGDQYFQLS